VGFTPVEILDGIRQLLMHLAAGRPRVTNGYPRVVRPEGNPVAQELLSRYFEPVDSVWRGLGSIPDSGYALRAAYAHRDASTIDVPLPPPREPRGCRCGEILKGAIEPPDCPVFATACTPDTPLGACMVSSEGTCAAWYKHERWAVGASR